MPCNHFARFPNDRTFRHIVRSASAVCLTLLLLTLLPSGHSAQLGPPAPPTVTAVAGKAMVTVSLSGGSNAQSYAVYKSGGCNPNGWTTVGGLAGTTLVDTHVSNGLTYCYKAYSYNSTYGFSAASNVASATVVLTAPALTVTPVKAGIAVSWDGVPDADSYDIYKSSVGTGDTWFGVKGNYTGTAFIDTVVSNERTYYYYAYARNAAGLGQKSGVASTSLSLPRRRGSRPRGPAGRSSSVGAAFRMPTLTASTSRRTRMTSSSPSTAAPPPPSRTRRSRPA